MKKVIEFFVNRSIFGNLITVGVIIMGVITLSTMKREAFPKVDFDIVIITTIYPGASPEDIENLIISPIERELKSVDGLKKIDSNALESRGAIVLTLEPSLENKNVTIQDIKDAVDIAKADFREEVKEPTVTELSTKRTPIIEIALSSDSYRHSDSSDIASLMQLLHVDATEITKGKIVEQCKKHKNISKKQVESIIVDLKSSDRKNILRAMFQLPKKHNRLANTIDKALVKFRLKPLSEFKLREYAEQLADKIELISDVAGVNKRGYRDREMHVEVDPDKMSANNISVDDIINAIKNRNVNFPGGTVIEDGIEYSIRTVKEYDNTTQMRNTIVRANDLGSAISIGDIAVVRDDFEKKTILEKANGNEAIILTVLKKEQGDAISLVDRVEKILEEYKIRAPAQLEITTFNDLSFYIRRRLKVLTSNVTIGMVLVLSSLLFFLGWRVALMVALGIPFSFGITFILMGYFDISINLISMFGLIIVSGMLVDDAIVVGENVYRHIERGIAPVKAAVLGAKEMVAPVIGSVSTTIVAFLPLMFMSGIMGKFVWYIPAAVIIALFASLFESFLILPAHIADITKGASAESNIKNEHSFEARAFRFLQGFYRPILEWTLAHKYTSIILVAFMFLFSAMLIPKIGFELFPKGGVEIFIYKAEAKTGVSLDNMNKRIAPIEKAIRELPENELDSFVARIGIHQEQPNDPFTKRGKNYAQVAVYLTPESQRSRKAEEIIGYLQRKTDQAHHNYYLHQFTYKSQKTIMQITNRDTVDLFSKNDFKNPVKRFKVTNEYLLGGGLISNHKLLLYSAENKLIVYDTVKEKVLSEENIDLKIYDSPRFFTVLPGSQTGLLVTDFGYLYALTKGSQENLQKFSSVITGITTFPKSKRIAISTDLGSVELYEYDKEGDVKLQYKIHNAARMQSKDGKVHFMKKQLSELARVENVYINDDESLMYISCFDGTVRVYDLKQNKIVANHYLSSYAIQWVMPDKDNNENLWLSQKDIIRLYNSKEEKYLQFNKGKSSQVVVGEIEKAFIMKSGIKAFGSYGLVLQLSAKGKGLVELNSGERTLEKSEFKQLSNGPPVGAAVQLEVRGDDYNKLKKVSKIIQRRLAAIEGVYDIRDNWEEGKSEFHLKFNEKTAARAGVSVYQAASTIQTAFEGAIASSIKKSKEEIDIRVVFPEHLREKLSSLYKVKVRNNIGNLVPITTLATFDKKAGVSIITHSSRRRTIFVRANIDARKSSSVKVNREILAQMKPVMAGFSGVDLFAGGEYEDTQESMRDLLTAAAVAILGIAAILVLLFRNLRHPRVIMAAIPLGMVGVSIAFFIHKLIILPNLVFSFLASMGIVGLAGVVVNDSIVLVDFINKLRRAGYSLHDAIVGGGLSRLRAVLLTTITTSAGLMPTAYGIGGDDPFLKPMALAMAWGLAFATVITLIIIPVYYSIWEERGYVFHHAFSKKKKGVN